MALASSEKNNELLKLLRYASERRAEAINALITTDTSIGGSVAKRKVVPLPTTIRDEIKPKNSTSSHMGVISSSTSVITSNIDEMTQVDPPQEVAPSTDKYERVKAKKRKNDKSEAVRVKVSLQMISPSSLGVQFSSQSSIVTKRPKKGARFKNRLHVPLDDERYGTALGGLTREEGIIASDLIRIINHVATCDSFDSSLDMWICPLSLQDTLVDAMEQYEEGTLDSAILSTSQLNEKRDIMLLRNRVRMKRELEICRINPFVQQCLSEPRIRDETLYHHHTLSNMSCTALNCDSKRLVFMDDVKELLPEKLRTSLHAFQCESLLFAMERHGRVMIADEMGLGKTIQALATSTLYREEWPLLIICPSSLRSNWECEIHKWLPFISHANIHVIQSSRDAILPHRDTQVVIVSYDLVSRMFSTEEDTSLPKVYGAGMGRDVDAFLCKELFHDSGFHQPRFRVIIADESHYLKNADAKRTESILPLLLKATRLIMLSGTPTLARPVELWTQLHALQPGLFGSFKAFAYRYCDTRQGRFGVTYKGAHKLKQLFLLATKYALIRRLKSEVLTSLQPKKRRAFVYDIMKDHTESEGELGELMLQLKKMKDLVKREVRKQMAAADLEADENDDVDDMDDVKLNVSANDHARQQPIAMNPRILGLYQQSGMVKAQSVCDHVDKLLTEEKLSKLIIFGHHKVVLDRIENFLVERDVSYFRFDGRTPAKERHQMVTSFQTDPAMTVALLSLTAAGVGLTLTAAHRVVFAELSWTPALLLQAEDRVHRIGQTKTVLIDYIVSRNTIDDVIWPVLARKLNVVGSLISGRGDTFESTIID